MFPVSVNGQIELRALQPQHVRIVTDSIKRQLEAARARDMGQHDNIISFRNGLFPSRLISSLNMLGPLSQGKIEVCHGTPAVIKYRLSAIGMLIDVLVIALAAAILINITGGLPKALLVFPCIFCVLFGANYLIAILRLRSFLRLAAAVHGERPFICPNCGSLYDPSDYRDDAIEKRCAACNELLKDDTSAGS